MDVWLNDGLSRMLVDSNDTPLEFHEMTVWLIPQRVGTFRINARVDDRCGQSDQTGAIRTVVIQ